MDGQLLNLINKTSYNAFKCVIFSAIFLISLFVGQFCRAELLWDASAGDNNVTLFGVQTWDGNTFLISDNDFTLSTIEAKLTNYQGQNFNGKSPVRASVFNTSAGLPTGSAIFSCDFVFAWGSDITTEMAGAYYTFNCPTPKTTLTKDTLYALAFSLPNGVNSTLGFRMAFRNRVVNSTWYVVTDNSGSSWYHQYYLTDADTSLIFKINGAKMS